jgi:flagellar motor switch protein FliN
MTTAVATQSILDLARASAAAALAVLPVAAPLVVGEPDAGPVRGTPEGEAVTARFTGAASGEVVIVVGQDLTEALRSSPLGQLDVTTAVRPALEAAAGAFGPVVVDPGQPMPPAVALSALAAKPGTVVVPLMDGAEVSAMVALRLDPWPRSDAAPSPEVNPGPRTTSVPGWDLLHDVEMEVSAELGRTRMNVRDLLSLSPGVVVELDRAAGSPADLLVNGRLVARGEVVVIDENFGIRVTEIVAHGGTD